MLLLLILLLHNDGVDIVDVLYYVRSFTGLAHTHTHKELIRFILNVIGIPRLPTQRNCVFEANLRIISFISLSCVTLEKQMRVLLLETVFFNVI